MMNYLMNPLKTTDSMMKELMIGNESVSSVLMRFHQNDFLSEREVSETTKTPEFDSPFRRDPKEISNIVIREQVLQMLYSASLRKRLLGNQYDSVKSGVSERDENDIPSSASKLCLHLLRQYLKKDKIPLDALNHVISEIEPLSLFRKINRQSVEIGVPLDPLQVSPRDVRRLIGSIAADETTWKSKPGVDSTRIEIRIPNDSCPSSLLLRFPDHASRMVRIVLRQAEGGNVLFDSATSSNAEARNNAILSARRLLMSNSKDNSSSTIVQRIDLRDFESLNNLTIELSRLELPLLLQSFADSVPTGTRIPGRSSEAYFELSGVEILRKIEVYDESDALCDIERGLVNSIESFDEDDKIKSITLLWKLALARGSLQSLLHISELVLKLNICPKLDNRSRDFLKNTYSSFGPTLISKDRVMYVVFSRFFLFTYSEYSLVSLMNSFLLLSRSRIPRSQIIQLECYARTQVLSIERKESTNRTHDGISWNGDQRVETKKVESFSDRT